MKQCYCLLILIVLICGISQMHCNSFAVKNQWQEAATELDFLKTRANYLLNISHLQINRTSAFMSRIIEEATIMAKAQIRVEIDLSLLDINEWKELTVSFGLEPPSECVADQEAALKNMATEFVHSIESCGQYLIIGPCGQIRTIITNIKGFKTIIDNLYDQFYACGQDATCLWFLYPQISIVGQYNSQIRNQIFLIEEVFGGYSQYVDKECVTPILGDLKRSVSAILLQSKECLQDAITALGQSFT